MTISIVMPTIVGREHWLEKTLASIEQFTVVPHEVLVERDHPGCGPAWQAGGERACGDYILMGADDLEVMAGWDTAAVEACERGVLPAPRVWYPDGRLQSCGESWEVLEPDGDETMFTRVPFMSRAQWDVIQPMLPTHYWTDNWVSWRGWNADPVIPTVVTYGFQFVHHLAPERRDESRMSADGDIFFRATQGEDVWT